MRVLAAGRTAVDAHSSQVHLGYASRRPPSSSECGRESPASPRFFQQTSWNVLRTVGRPHAVDLHHDEAQFGHRLRDRGTRANRFGTRDESCGPGVDVFDDRVLRCCGSKLDGRIDHAVDVGLAVAPFGAEALGRLPAGLQQFDCSRPLPVRQTSEPSLARRSSGDRRQVDARVRIDQELCGLASTRSLCVPSPSVSMTRSEPSKSMRQ